MKVTLYTNEGFTWQGEKLTPVQSENAGDLLAQLFNLVNAGKTVTLIQDGTDGINYMITIRNKDDQRRYLAELLTEVSATFKLTM